jgi:iron complex transport system ATP-binding protein
MTLHARDMSIRRGAFELGPVNLAFEPGRIYGVVGPNASGKTTLVRGLCGLQPIQSGTVALADAIVHAMDAAERASRIAFVPQRPMMPPALRVGEVVALGRLRMRRDPLAEEDALRQVGLLERRNERADELSAGQSHRVAVARMLAQLTTTTRLVVMDEPTASLDPAWSASVGRLTRACAQRGCAVIVATHDFGFLGACCDEAVLVAGGRLKEVGPVASVATPESLSALFGAPFGWAHGLAARPVAMPCW